MSATFSDKISEISISMCFLIIGGIIRLTRMWILFKERSCYVNYRVDLEKQTSAEYKCLVMLIQ